jgi:Holliday junction resolvasome RuvABC endonuclease subunit
MPESNERRIINPSLPALSVVGLDPGLASFGYAVAELTPPGLRFTRTGVWRTKPTARKRGIRKADSDTERVVGLATHVLTLLDTVRPVAVCIESGALPYGRVRGSVVAGLGRVRGAVDALCHVAKVALLENSPQALKISVVGKANAGKAEVQAALEALYPELRDLWPEQATLVEHAADAAAAVVTCRNDSTILAALRAREAA